MSDDAFRYDIKDIQLISSKGGVFEVTVEKQLVFSKKKEGRHANPGEVVQLIKQMKKD